MEKHKSILSSFQQSTATDNSLQTYKTVTVVNSSLNSNERNHNVSQQLHNIQKSVGFRFKTAQHGPFLSLRFLSRCAWHQVVSDFSRFFDLLLPNPATHLLNALYLYCKTEIFLVILKMKIMQCILID